MKTLIVIPTYNEIENIESLVHHIFSLSLPVNPHILVVDDNSPDGTAQAIKELMGQKECRETLHLLERPGKLGLGTAYIEGFKWGMEREYDVLIEMDADFSHNPEYLPHLITQLKESDFIIASRYVKGGGVRHWGLLRKAISRFGSLYAKLILSVPMNDLTGGYNLWRSEVLEKIGLDNIQSNGYAFQVELKYKAWKNGFSYKEYPIIFVDRNKGKSKMSKSIVFEAMYRVWKIRFSNN